MEFTGENIKITPWKESILDTIRERPAVYVGVKSITALWYFLQGYELSQWRNGRRVSEEIPEGFSEWVAYRLHLESSRCGLWHLAILDGVRDEASAVDRFYELRDECFKFDPVTVATIRNDRRGYRIGRHDAAGNVIWGTELLPASLKIIVYTDDPGFFLSCDAGESLPETFFDNGRFFPAFSAWNEFSPDRFHVQDELTWRRLTVDDARYRRNLGKRRARIRKKEASAS